MESAPLNVEEPDRGWRKLADFLALRRNTCVLLAALLLMGTGERLWLGFVPKYLQFLGAGVFIIGLFDALQTLLGAVYAYPGGWLTDHWGQRKSLLTFNAISIVGYGMVLVWQDWLAVVLGAFLFLAWSALSLPATFTVVATAVDPQQHTMGIGVQSMMRRIPMIIGPIAGGWLVTRFGWDRGIQYALLGCIVLGLATAILQWLLIEPPVATSTKEQSSTSFFSVVRSFTPALRELLVSDILIRFCERIPYAFVILWAIDSGHVTPQQFGYLVAIEMVTAMCCYIPVAHLADKYGRVPFVLATFVFFTLFPLSLLVAQNFWLLVPAFIVRGLKEFGEPARKALIIGEAAPEIRSRTYGAYYLIRDCIVTGASFLGAWLWSISPQANFIGAATCGLIGTVCFGWFVLHGTHRHRERSVRLERRTG
jgi:MFS family permease